MENNGNHILDVDVIDLLKQQIQLHTEKAKFHTEKAELLKRQLSLLLGVTRSSGSPDAETNTTNPEEQDGLGFSDIKIFKSDVENFLEKSAGEKSHKTEDIVAGIAPDYLVQPELRKLAINKVSQILLAGIKQGRITKHKSSGKGNRYKINKAYLEKLEEMRERQ